MIQIKAAAIRCLSFCQATALTPSRDGHLFGSIDSRERFVDHRFELALHEWARFKANDSLECRNCHSAESMDITKQSPRAAVAHQRFLFNGEKTCIDCHKGIAHHLPDMRGIPGWQ